MCRSTVVRETHAAIWSGQGIRLTVSQINSISVLRILLRQIPILTFNVWLSARSFVSPTRNIDSIKKLNRTPKGFDPLEFSFGVFTAAPVSFQGGSTHSGGQANGMSFVAVSAIFY